MRRRLGVAVAIGLAPVLAATSACGGDQGLSEAQGTAYEQVMAYERRAGEIVTRGEPYREEAAARMRENVRVLQEADLGEDAEAALSTIAETPHEVTNPDRPDPERTRGLEEAVATLRDAVESRRE